MLNDKCYNMNAQLSVIKSDEYEYTWPSIKAVNCLKRRDDFFDGNISSKYVYFESFLHGLYINSITCYNG